MKDIYLLTGGNIGDRLQNLQKAYGLIEKSVGPVVKKSSIYETAAWGFTKQEAFFKPGALHYFCIRARANVAAAIKYRTGIRQKTP